jgi:DNA-binding PadR family transcriptional regulator
MSIKHGILAILSRRPLHGYELKQELEVELGANWSLNFGQIYTTLGRLERDGLIVQSDIVAVDDAPDRKMYANTSAGSEALTKWFLTPVSKLDGLRDEFYAKVILSLTSNISTDEVLQIQRKTELQKLHELTRLKEAADPVIDLAWILQIDLAILYAEATLRWLNMCEARLKKLQELYSSGPVIRTRQQNKLNDEVGKAGRRRS